jgi:hypothetical protein
VKRIFVALLVVLSPLPALADDASYCAALSDVALKYLSYNSKRGEPDGDVAMAIHQCENGNTAAGIPTLEGKLKNNGFTLPKR